MNAFPLTAGKNTSLSVFSFARTQNLSSLAVEEIMEDLILHLHCLSSCEGTKLNKIAKNGRKNALRDLSLGNRVLPDLVFAKLPEGLLQDRRSP